MSSRRKGACRARGVRAPALSAEDGAVPGRRPAAADLRAALHRDGERRASGRDLPFGVCLITRGEEVALRPSRSARFRRPSARWRRMSAWDMPQLGILHVTANGGERFHVRSQRVEADGLVVARGGADSGRARRCARLGALRAAREAARAHRRTRRPAPVSRDPRVRRRFLGRLPARRAPAAAAVDQAGHARDQRRRRCALRCCRSSCSSRVSSEAANLWGGRYNFRFVAGTGRSDHGWPQQMGEHQAQEGGHRREARQDLHPPDPRNHRRREDGRRRSVDEPAAAPRDRQGDREEHAEGHDRARGQARRG